MKILRVLLCVLIVQGVCFADTYDWLKGTYFTLVIVDTWSTFTLLEQGGYVEANSVWQPIIKHRELTMAIDFCVLMTLNLVFDTLKKTSKPLAYIVLGVFLVVQSYVVYHNVSML